MRYGTLIKVGMPEVISRVIILNLLKYLSRIKNENVNGKEALKFMKSWRMSTWNYKKMWYPDLIKRPTAEEL